jgi:aspartokinase
VAAAPRRRELRVSGVALETELLVVRGEGGTAELTRLAALLARHGAWPREWWLDERGSRALVSLENVHGLPALLEELRPLSPGVSAEEGLSVVSVVGTGLGAGPEPLLRMLDALREPPRGVSVLPLRLSALVPRGAGAECVRRLHAEFVEPELR